MSTAEKKPRKKKESPILITEPDTTQQMLLFEKLGKDQAKSADQLRRGQVRWLVDSYYITQRDRCRATAQVRASMEAGEQNDLLTWFAETYTYTENSLKKALGRFAKRFTVGRWLQSIHGIGPVISAGLLCHFDIRIANHAGRFQAYAGLDPTKKWEKGEKRPWNADLKKLLVFAAGECFVKTQNSDKSYYGKLFRMKRDELEKANEAGAFKEQAAEILASKNFGKETNARAAYEAGKLPPAHLHARARRWVVKLFVSHLHHVMYEDYHGKPPEMPWVFTRAENRVDHTHYYAPPNWPMTTADIGLPIADLYIGSQEPARMKRLTDEVVMSM